MTLIRHEKIPAIKNGKPIKKFRNKVTIKCDSCGNEKIFETCALSYIEQNFHFCSRQCFILLKDLNEEIFELISKSESTPA